MNVDLDFNRKELLTIDFIEFLFHKEKREFNDGNGIREKITVKKAVMKLENLIDESKIKSYWHIIPPMYERFKFKIAEGMKSKSYDTLKDLYEYKYSLREKEFLYREIIEQHKQLLNEEKLKQEHNKEQQNLLTNNIDYNNYLIRYINMAVTYIDHQLNVFDKFSRETKQEQNVEKVVESKTILKKHKIKVDLNQFEFALLLAILKEQGIFSEYKTIDFDKEFKDFIMDNFLYLHPKTGTYEPPKSMGTIFPHVYSQEGRRKGPHRKLSSGIEDAFRTLAEKYLVDIRNIKFNTHKS